LFCTKKSGVEVPFTISYHEKVVKNDIPALPAAIKVIIMSALETKLAVFPVKSVSFCRKYDIRKQRIAE
jgi:hypothetical protein